MNSRFTKAALSDISCVLGYFLHVDCGHFIGPLKQWSTPAPHKGQTRTSQVAVSVFVHVRVIVSVFACMRVCACVFHACACVRAFILLRESTQNPALLGAVVK
jgi:uncharacterized Tic20 family protein